MILAFLSVRFNGCLCRTVGLGFLAGWFGPGDQSGEPKDQGKFRFFVVYFFPRILVFFSRKLTFFFRYHPELSIPRFC